MAKQPKTTLVSLRLRESICADCDWQCGVAAVIRCPACHAVLPTDRLDEWEVYDDCAICPTCDRVVAGYECFTICGRELVTAEQQRLFT